MPVSFIEYKGKKILYEDFSNVELRQASALLDEAAAIIRSQPPKSVLALVNVTDSHYDAAVSAKMKEFVRGNTPYIRHAAIFGMSGLQSIVYRAILLFTGRKNLKVCADEQEAKEFLVHV